MPFIWCKLQVWQVNYSVPRFFVYVFTCFSMWKLSSYLNYVCVPNKTLHSPLHTRQCNLTRKSFFPYLNRDRQGELCFGRWHQRWQRFYPHGDRLGARWYGQSQQNVWTAEKGKKMSKQVRQKKIIKILFVKLRTIKSKRREISWQIKSRKVTFLHKWMSSRQKTFSKRILFINAINQFYFSHKSISSVLHEEEPSLFFFSCQWVKMNLNSKCISHSYWSTFNFEFMFTYWHDMKKTYRFGSSLVCHVWICLFFTKIR